MAEPDKATKPAAPAAPPPTLAVPAATPAPTPASPPGGNAVSALESAPKVVAQAPTAAIDLQGKGRFEPTPEVAEYIRLQKHKGAPIPVKFGNVTNCCHM